MLYHRLLLQRSGERCPTAFLRRRASARTFRLQGRAFVGSTISASLTQTIFNFQCPCGAEFGGFLPVFVQCVTSNRPRICPLGQHSQLLIVSQGGTTSRPRFMGCMFTNCRQNVSAGFVHTHLSGVHFLLADSIMPTRHPFDSRANRSRESAAFLCQSLEL
jgi:hypothetical protein